MKIVKKLLLAAGFLIGLGIFAYPTVSNWLAVRNQIQAIQSYDKYVTGLSQEQIDQEWEKARNYNDLLQAGTVTDPFSDVAHVEPFTEYEETLNIEGIMGYIEIPAINADLPIYHGVSEEVLMRGAGHIKSTALPVGGASTHAVLAAHSGLPEARLFNDLETLQEGDYFFIYVLNEVLAYQVDQISVVEPDDVSQLQPEEGKDYVTLLTCTPIGINTHRLLVRGERCEMPKPKPESNGRSLKIDWVLVVLAGLILLLLFYLYRKRRKRKALLLALSVCILGILPGDRVTASGNEQVYLEVSVDDLVKAPGYGQVAAGDEHNIWLPILAMAAGAGMLCRKSNQKVKGKKHVGSNTNNI